MMTPRADLLANAIVAVGGPHKRCGECGTNAYALARLVDEILDQLTDDIDQVVEDDVTTGAHPEIRIVNDETGAEKGTKLARFDLLPAEALWQVAEMYGRGASKYADRNWELGHKWSLSFAAMMRHAWAFWGGEDDDPETGLPHLAAVVFHAFSLMTYRATHPGLDDRPSR